MRGITLRILGTDVLELYIGKPESDGTKPAPEEHPALSSHTDIGFGFVPAHVEWERD